MTHARIRSRSRAAFCARATRWRTAVCSTSERRGTSFVISASGLRARAGERVLDLAARPANRHAEHREDGARIFAPARRRQLCLAHRAITVQLEKPVQRSARRAVGERVEAGRRLELDDGARFGLAPREGGDVHDGDAGARALEIANAAGERLREPVGAERSDPLQEELEGEVGAERARSAREHHAPRFVEQRMDVADALGHRVVGEDGEIERVARPERFVGVRLEPRDVVVEAELLAHEARRRHRKARIEAAARHVADLRRKLVAAPSAAELDERARIEERYLRGDCA